MPLSPDQSELIRRAVDDEPCEQTARELSALLRESPEARAAYLDYLDLHALLDWDRAEREQETGDRGTGTGRASQTSHIAHRTSNISVVYALAAALILTAAVVAIYVFVFSAHRTSNIDDRTSSPPIATLIDATDTVIVGENIANPGGDYPAGAYAIEAGSAQFLLTNRVGVELHGETRLRMHNNMRGTLTRGVVAFRCPPEAKGFTVGLPHGVRVVDLGTAFEIATDDDGRSHITVSEGRVRVERPGAPPVELASGGSIGVDVAGNFRPTEEIRLVGLGPEPLYTYEHGDDRDFTIDRELESATIATWLQIHSLPREYAALLMSDGWGGTGKTHWQLVGDRPQLAVFDSDQTGSPHYKFEQSVPVGRMVHLAVTLDRDTRTAVVYLEGVAIGSSTLEIYTPLRIGAARVAGWNTTEQDATRDRDLDGRIHRLEVYGTALDADTIARLAGQTPNTEPKDESTEAIVPPPTPGQE